MVIFSSMVWQDIALSIASVLLGYALLPQVIKGFKEKRQNLSLQTSILTVLGLMIITISYFTLGLAFSTIVTGITTTLWIILLIQVVVYGRSKK